MDFFEHQEAARRNTTRLVLLFALAVLAIAGMVYGVVVGVLAFQLEVPLESLLVPRVFVSCLGAVLAFVAVGSLWKMHALGKGGSVIALRLGGRRLEAGSTDPLERRILNVVEEMAIASGTPVPPVYLLDAERGINAFAAGHDLADAVVGVTRGAVEKLTRDELQGVVAHEFSHILHGDMGLNLRLVGVIHGIELIGLLGRALLRGSGGRRRGKKGGGGALVGLALLLIGALGSLCGKLIRSAVSKQREFLADASAVQYTRNPSGIAGALKKIGGLATGSRLDHPRSAEASHMFFGAGLGAWKASGLFDTHPPLGERVRRIEPGFADAWASVPEDFVARWQGEAFVVARGAPLLVGALTDDERPDGVPPPSLSPDVARTSAREPDVGGERDRRVRAGAAESRPPAGPALPAEDPETLLGRLGDPGPEHIAWARALVAGLPPAAAEAAHDRDGVRALVYALFTTPAVEGQTDLRALQLGLIERSEGPALRVRVEALAAPLAGLDPRARLPLLEIACGTLARMEPDGYEGFRDVVQALTEADREVDLAEWVLAGLLLRDLDRRFRRVRAPRPRYSRLAGLGAEVGLLLSTLARVGQADEVAARRAFAAAAASLALDGDLLPAAHCSPRALEATLMMLAELVPEQKRRVLGACARCVTADREVEPGEAELFRVVADWLDCPAPPLLPGQRLA